MKNVGIKKKDYEKMFKPLILINSLETILCNLISWHKENNNFFKELTDSSQGTQSINV